MQITDEMVRVAAHAIAARRDCDGDRIDPHYYEDAKDALSAVLAHMWRYGDDMYTIDGEVLAFWKPSTPELIGEFGVTEFNGDFWVNPDDENDPFRDPDCVMALSPPASQEG